MTQTIAEPAVWMMVTEVAGYTRLSTRTIWRMISDGTLKAYRPTVGRVLLSRAEVDEVILKSHLVPGRDAGRPGE